METFYSTLLYKLLLYSMVIQQQSKTIIFHLEQDTFSIHSNLSFFLSYTIFRKGLQTRRSVAVS